MSTRLRTGLALAGSFALGGGLLYVALRGADLGAVARAIRDGAWGWMLPLALVTVLSVVARAWRWTLLLDTLPQADGTPQRDRTPFGIALSSVMIGYLVNLAVPRLGEAVRAGNIAARRPLGFVAVAGTVVAERLLDVAMLAVALASVSLIFGARLGAVAVEAVRGVERLVAGLPAAVDVLLAAAVIAAIAAVVWLRIRARRAASATPSAGRGLAAQFRDGALTLVRTGRPGALAASTLVIWACYATMSYLPLRILGMDAAYGLGPIDAWALMTVGAVGMTLPAPGGAGSFHYATIQTLVLLFAVPVLPATSYAVLGHAAQLVFYAVAGAIALLVQGTGLRTATAVATAASTGAAPEGDGRDGDGRPVVRPARPAPIAS
ncbi:MAG TPA: lysylphosphatidylglycerol synthase transmembrane domain-containing protein [Rubricoccaceae bacterium]